MKNFDREYRVLIGENGKSGREIGKKENGRALRCQFSCELGESSSSNTGRITLWNLAPDTIRLLAQEDCLIELRAGYQDDLPVIMGGTLLSVKTTKDSADKKTEIEFADGFKTMRDTTISLSYDGSINGKNVIEDAVKDMGCALQYSDGATFSDVKNFAFVGKGKTLLDKICNPNGLRWSIQNGIIQICATNEPITMVAYRLSADTGLIGSPAPIFKSSSSSDKSGKNTTKRKSKRGIEVNYFLNGHVQIDDYIRLESKEYTGNYRVSKVKFDGDSESGDWKCTTTLMEV